MIRRPPRSTPFPYPTLFRSTVLPGLVGMHNHLFFPMGGSPPMYSNMGTSFPRLYLALGVTTIRTTGSVAPRSEEHTSELQSRQYLVCRLLLEKKKISKS